MQAALEAVRAAGITDEQLSSPDPADEQKLADVLSRKDDLAKLDPSAEEKAAWIADCRASARTFRASGSFSNLSASSGLTSVVMT